MIYQLLALHFSALTTLANFNFYFNHVFKSKSNNHMSRTSTFKSRETIGKKWISRLRVIKIESMVSKIPFSSDCLAKKLQSSEPCFKTIQKSYANEKQEFCFLRKRILQRFLWFGKCGLRVWVNIRCNAFGKALSEISLKEVFQRVLAILLCYPSVRFMNQYFWIVVWYNLRW